MSDAEHLIENAIMAMEKYPYEESRRVFFETPINIMMSKDSGCPMNAVWEMAVYCDTTLRQYWREKWEDEADKRISVVRCKDCKRRKTEHCAMYYECADCETQCTWESDNDYCSMGEMRDGGI